MALVVDLEPNVGIVTDATDCGLLDDSGTRRIIDELDTSSPARPANGVLIYVGKQSVAITFFGLVDHIQCQ